GQVAAVAAAADAAAGFTGQTGADLHLLDAGLLDGVGQIVGDLFILRHQNLAGERIVDVFLRDPADDTVAERLEDVAAFHDRGDHDAVERLAILFGNDHVLRDVDETPREVAG